LQLNNVGWSVLAEANVPLLCEDGATTDKIFFNIFIPFIYDHVYDVNPANADVNEFH